MNKHIGKQTVQLEKPPVIINSYSIGGVKEGEGPLSSDFDMILTDDKWEEDSWEKAESKLQKEAANAAVSGIGLKTSDIDYVLAGDLQNQCVGAHYGMRDIGVPFFGIYGACSTMTESMSLGSMLIDGGFADKVLCVTSSHFCSAEKQFRFPLEYGGQRTPTAQWTVTGSGAALLSNSGNGPRITHVTTGKITDYGVADINNMGAAMAPAAYETLKAHFEDTGREPDFYDLILTGDLGTVGSDILCDLMHRDGYNIYPMHNDCGKMIYDIKAQDVHAGGSGCGCMGSVFCGHIMKKLKSGELKNILVMATGALMNPSIVLQNESIPGIAHAVAVTAE